jgi:NAD(P)-dependent dehydrogenase (short-subunit alcohol dehydrogenase family)
MALDLTDFHNVKQFSIDFLQQFSTLHYFVENAGSTANINGTPLTPSKTLEGIEHLYAANYLGHFLLVQLLLPTMLQTSSSSFTPQIVAMSSIFHWLHDTKNLEALLPVYGYWARHLTEKEQNKFLAMSKQYGNTKFLQICMCFELQKRISMDDLVITPVIPGFVKSDIGHTFRSGQDRGFPLVNILQVDPVMGSQTAMNALLENVNDGKVSKADGGFVLQPYWTPLHQQDTLFRNIDLFLIWETLLQKWSWGLYRWKAHPNAYNLDFTEKLWEESLEVISEYL